MAINPTIPSLFRGRMAMLVGLVLVAQFAGCQGTEG